VIALSVYAFASNGVGSPGVTAGKPLHHFVAPLATSGLNLDANAKPRCDAARPNPAGLNVCGRDPIVLAFFVTGSTACEAQVDALQALSLQPKFHGIQFAAVAVHADRRQTLKEVRRHRWSIPIAYDRDGSVGDLYGIEICPLVELARRGGVVARRLIGEHWTSTATLAPELQALRRGGPLSSGRLGGPGVSRGVPGATPGLGLLVRRPGAELSRGGPPAA